MRSAAKISGCCATTRAAGSASGSPATPNAAAIAFGAGAGAGAGATTGVAGGAGAAATSPDVTVAPIRAINAAPIAAALRAARVGDLITFTTLSPGTTSSLEPPTAARPANHGSSVVAKA